MRSLLFFSLISLVACNAKQASVSSGSINANAPFLWDTNFPKTVSISTAFGDPNNNDPLTERNKIKEMMTAWETSVPSNAVGGRYFNVLTTAATEDTDTINGVPSLLRDSYLNIYKAGKDKWPFPKYQDALAITQIFALRENRGASNEFLAIQEADIIMNFDYFCFDGQSGGIPNCNIVFDNYDFRTVMLHELGHFLGLQHNESVPRTQTVMYPLIRSDETKRSPFQADREILADKYNYTLPLSAGGKGSSIVAPRPNYVRNPGTVGEPTRIILELKASGECVHHIDGVEISRHQMEK